MYYMLTLQLFSPFGDTLHNFFDGKKIIEFFDRKEENRMIKWNFKENYIRKLNVYTQF